MGNINDKRKRLAPGTVLSYKFEGKEYEVEVIKAFKEGGLGLTYLARYREKNGGVYKECILKEFFPYPKMGYPLRDKHDNVIFYGENGDKNYFNKPRSKFSNEYHLIYDCPELREPECNVVEVYHYFCANNTEYYTSKYLKEGALSDTTKFNNPMPELTAVQYILDICVALNICHQKRIIHHDITPSNIVIDLVKNRKVAHLIDFGAAKRYRVDLKSMSVLEGPETKAQPAFRSPYQIDDSSMQIYHPQSDIYQLALVLFWLLTGKTQRLNNSEEDIFLDLGSAEKFMCYHVLCKALQIKRKANCHSDIEIGYQTIDEFQKDLESVYNALLDSNTRLEEDKKLPEEGSGGGSEPIKKQWYEYTWFWFVFAFVAVLLAYIILGNHNKETKDDNNVLEIDTTRQVQISAKGSSIQVDTTVVLSLIEAPIENINQDQKGGKDKDVITKGVKQVNESQVQVKQGKEADPVISPITAADTGLRKTSQPEKDEQAKPSVVPTASESALTLEQKQMDEMTDKLRQVQQEILAYTALYPEMTDDTEIVFIKENGFKMKQLLKGLVGPSKSYAIGKNGYKVCKIVKVGDWVEEIHLKK